jgi:predicted RNA-binding protein with PIN domain
VQSRGYGRGSVALQWKWKQPQATTLMLILIDGYNLMYAVGWANKGMTNPQWNAARRRLLDWLAEAQTKQKSHQFQVILDAQNLSKKYPSQSVHHGLAVIQAQGETADDYIETLLVKLNRTTNLVVVSDDHRLADAAKRSQATRWRTSEFLDWLDRPSSEATPAEPMPPEKPIREEDDTEREKLLTAFSIPRKKR